MADSPADLVERLLDVRGNGEDVAGVAEAHLFSQVDANLVIVRRVERRDLAHALRPTETDDAASQAETGGDRDGQPANDRPGRSGGEGRLADDDAGGTGGELGADEIRFDDTGRVDKGGSEVLMEKEQLSTDKTMRSAWLRRVQNDPAEFLSARFAYQLYRDQAEGRGR